MSEGEIYFVTELTADLGAGDVSAAEGCERDAHAVVQSPGAPDEGL